MGRTRRQCIAVFHPNRSILILSLSGKYLDLDESRFGHRLMYIGRNRQYNLALPPKIHLGYLS